MTAEAILVQTMRAWDVYSHPLLPRLYLEPELPARLGAVSTETHAEMLASAPRGMEHLLGCGIANDLAELMIEGDTDSDDPFLALLDGLKKLQEWPAGLLVHDASLITRPHGRTKVYVVKFRLVWLPALPDVSTHDFDSIIPAA